MKNYNVWLGIAFVMFVGVVAASQIGSTTEVVSKTASTTVKTVEVHPDWAQDEDAIKAAQDVIRQKELSAKEAELISEISNLQDELDEVRKELGSY